VVAEAVGTALLLAAVVGSGIMGSRLAGGQQFRNRSEFIASRFQPGDVVWVIIPSTTPRWAILAELYE